MGSENGKLAAVRNHARKRRNEMFAKLLFKRILPTLLALALLFLGGLWLYGYAGVKFGWLDPFKYSSLNAITKHGADVAGDKDAPP